MLNAVRNHKITPSDEEDSESETESDQEEGENEEKDNVNEKGQLNLGIQNLLYFNMID